MKLTFIKDKTDNLWRVKLPFFTRHQRLMVGGADLFLQLIDDNTNNDGSVTIDFSLKDTGKSIVVLDMIEHNAFGGTYAVKDNLLNYHLNSKLWLCNVTHFVLGRHPKRIYIDAVM